MIRISLTLVLTIVIVLCFCGVFVNGVANNDETPARGALNKEDFMLVTVATNETDGYKRFAHSAEVYKVPVTVLGMGEKWLGGDMNFAGGGHKINLLKQHLEQFKDDPNKVVLFTDSYDVMLLGSVDKILSAFERFDARIVFSAEGFCWPDVTLASKYPAAPRGKRYLNSGGFIGYAPEMYKMVTNSVVDNKADDQLYYTKIYLDQDLRIKLGIKLDHKAQIFQNLNGAVDDVELKFDENSDAYISNSVTGSSPLVLHGNGPSKLVLNTLSNYLARGWNSKDGCVTCWDNIINISKLELKDYPVVLLAVFIEVPTPFLEEFFDKINNIDYPKNKLHLFVHNNVEFHTPLVSNYLKEHEQEYRSIKTIDPTAAIKDAKARSLAMDYCLTKKCAYYFNVDSEAHLDNPNSLKLLVEQNRSIIAPVLVRPGKLWSNFWGAITADGFYARSLDYLEVVNGERRGLWNVPYIRSCYLINATLLASKHTRPSYESGELDSDMSFCQSIRDKEIFMYVSNRFEYGHLIDNDKFDITKFNPEIYQIFDNRYDWEQRYIHENYTENLNPNHTTLQPCPDVYWFPIVTERFCGEFIGIMENFGGWSDGSNKDERLDGGYENVPTRDIHMKQVGLEPAWMQFLKEYVRPMQELIFTGYFHNPPRSLMNFVVRYRPDEQASLRPHHDSSTYTINLALNRPNIDYEGGGCRFLRYNCSVTNTRMGWMLMHPGRLTHYHEGLLVTNGTRYIMISFVDP